MWKSGLGKGLQALTVMLFAGSAAAAQGDMGRPMGETGKTMNNATDGAEYTVVFKNMWTKSRHPFEYPEAGVISGPHFSGLIGGAHNASFSLFAEGMSPTAGLERLAEMGRHSPLDDEIRGAMSAGKVGALVASGPLRDLADSLVVTIRVDAAHPLVSLVAMIAPSPDWFTGVAGLSLQEKGSWVGKKTVELFAYDAGSDDGATYKADDLDVNPKKAVAKSMGKHFAPNGAPVPVATLTFIRK